MYNYDVDRLLFSVLERALKDIISYHSNPGSIHKDTYLDALDWFNQKGGHRGSKDFVFSFYSICSRLNISTGLFRDKVNKIAEGVDDIPKHLMGGSLWKSKKFTGSSKQSSTSIYPCTSAVLLPYDSVFELISWDTGYKGPSKLSADSLINEDSTSSWSED